MLLSNCMWKESLMLSHMHLLKVFLAVIQFHNFEPRVLFTLLAYYFSSIMLPFLIFILIKKILHRFGCKLMQKLCFLHQFSEELI